MESLPTESITIESLPVEIIAMIYTECDPFTGHMLSLCRAGWYKAIHCCECEKPCPGMCFKSYSICVDAVATLAVIHDRPDLFGRVMKLGDIEMCRTMRELIARRHIVLNEQFMNIEYAALHKGTIRSYEWVSSLPKCRWMVDNDLVTSNAVEYALEHGHIDAFKLFIASGFKPDDFTLMSAVKNLESFKHAFAIFPKCSRFTVNDAAQYGVVDVLKYMIEELGLISQDNCATHRAIFHDNVECLRYLLSGLDSFRGLLNVAIHFSRSECLRFLHETQPFELANLVTAMEHYKHETFVYVLDNMPDPATAIAEIVARNDPIEPDNAEAMLAEFRRYLPDL